MRYFTSNDGEVWINKYDLLKLLLELSRTSRKKILESLEGTFYKGEHPSAKYKYYCGSCREIFNSEIESDHIPCPVCGAFSVRLRGFE